MAFDGPLHAFEGQGVDGVGANANGGRVCANRLQGDCQSPGDRQAYSAELEINNGDVPVRIVCQSHGDMVDVGEALVRVLGVTWNGSVRIGFVARKETKILRGELVPFDRETRDVTELHPQGGAGTAGRDRNNDGWFGDSVRGRESEGRLRHGSRHGAS